MTTAFFRLIHIWLLLLTGSRTVSSGQHQNPTDVTTGSTRQNFRQDRVTPQDVSGLNVIMADGNQTEEKLTRRNTKPSFLSTFLKTFSPNIGTTQTQTCSISSQYDSPTVGIKSTAEVQLKFVSAATTEVASPVSIPATTTRAPLIETTSIQSQDTANTLTSQLITRPISPAQARGVISTTEPSENKSTSLVPAGVAMQSTSLPKSTTKKTSFINFTKVNKKQRIREETGTYYSKAVAGLIGGAVVMMMVGFLIIYIKGQKLRRQQMTTRDWAGPSPFIEGGANIGQVTLKSSNQIYLANFLSRRLSLLPEIDEQLEDITPARTIWK